MPLITHTRKFARQTFDTINTLKESGEDFMFVANKKYKSQHFVVMTPEKAKELLGDKHASTVDKLVAKYNEIISNRSKHLNE